MSITQIRPHKPFEYQCLEWIAMGSNRFNTMIPQYTNINRTPEYLSNVTANCTTDNFYWVSRLIGALADASINASKAEIERYVLKTLSKGHELIIKAENNILESDIPSYLESVNEEIAKMAEIESQELLNKVIKNASDVMKNAFSRADA